MTACLKPNTVPLPFVTQLAPVVMTSTGSPEIKTTIETNGPIPQTSNGSAQPTDNKDAASIKDAISTKAPSVMTADSVGNPSSPRTASTLPRYQFDRRDEKDAAIWIEKAHACIRRGMSHDQVRKTAHNLNRSSSCILRQGQRHRKALQDGVSTHSSTSSCWCCKPTPTSFLAVLNTRRVRKLPREHLPT
jgi:hypothetical protein